MRNAVIATRETPLAELVDGVAEAIGHRIKTASRALYKQRSAIRGNSQMRQAAATNCELFGRR
jgi:hypothetical protein